MEDLVVDLGRLYVGRRVFVAGHTGFKGGWLATWLKRLGADVTGFALAPDATPNLFEVADIARDMRSIVGDVRDLDALGRAFDASCPEIVFHLAAQSLVRRSYREPIETYATNVLGTINVLEACRRAQSVRACVVVTSDKCYENRGSDRAYCEHDALGGHDPYSSSKACAEIATAAYRRSFFADRGVGIASARAGNVIGGGDWAEDRLLPDIVRGAASGRPTLIRNPRFIRPWQHVLEPLSGYLILGQKLLEEPSRFAEAFNFGPGHEHSIEVGEVAQRFVERLGKGALELGPRPGAREPHEARHLELDAGKARSVVGWRPRLSLDRAIELTADWYRAYLADASTAAPEIDRQISLYTSSKQDDLEAGIERML